MSLNHVTLQGRIQNLKREGARIENKVTPTALPGSDPGDLIVDNLCSYSSEPHDHEATNTMSSVLILS
jgi:hypothetical protein